MLCTRVRKTPFSLGLGHHRMGIEGLPSLQLWRLLPTLGSLPKAKPQQCQPLLHRLDILSLDIFRVQYFWSRDRILLHGWYTDGWGQWCVLFWVTAVTAPAHSQATAQLFKHHSAFIFARESPLPTHILILYFC